MDFFSLAAILMFVIPALAVTAGGIFLGFKVNSHRKELYAANRSRLSAELLTLDEHISFAEAEADQKRAPYLNEARQELTAAFAAHNQHFSTDSHKGIAVNKATMEVDTHLNNARMFLTKPQNTNAELVDAAKELGRNLAQFARVGAAKLLTQGADSISRLTDEYQK